MTTGYEAYIFDLGGTLVAMEEDEIATDGAGRVRLLPGVAEALRALGGRPVFVITNQQGVALGTLTEAEARGFVEQVDAAAGGVLTDHRICMHLATADCPCRKPRPGMLLDLARAHGLDLARCLMVGDSENDRRCAEAAGVGAFEWAQTFFSRGARPAARDPLIPG
jgi:D-glycero-D-manno-heptose 1,7-bisphosphate phosphatase